MSVRETQQQILQIIDSFQKVSPHTLISDIQIAEQSGLDLQEVQDLLDIMKEAGYVGLKTLFGQHGRGGLVWLTSEGRILLHNPEYGQASPPQVTNNYTVNIVVTNRKGEDIRKLVDQLVEIVRSSNDIEPSVKQDYAQKAEDLKSEIKNPHPDLMRIREILAFLGDTAGTLELTARLTPYAIAFAPYIEQLKQLIQQWISLLPIP